MNKSKFAALVLGLAGFLAALPAGAQSFYFGGSIGNSQAKEEACPGGAATCDRSDTNWSGNIGFMFSPNWGMEMSYRDLGTIVESTDGVGGTSNWKTKAGDLVLVGALPVHSVSFYAKAGGYYAKTKLDSSIPGVTNAETSTRQWTYGAGIRWDVMRHVALRVEWQRYNNLGGQDVGFVSDVETLSGGVLIFF
jgi:OOP family OmpA-OmpF porin